MRSLVFLEDELSSVVRHSGAGHRRRPRGRPHRHRVPRGRLPAGDAAVRDLLDALGFAGAGRHRSKPVAWWRNGEAHLVVNEEGSGAPRATALGVSRRPVAAVAARAGALLWPEVDTSRGAGEAMLPGLTSPSGLHVFVSDTAGHPDHWQGDFEPTGAAGAGDLAGLDHVVISVSALQLNEEMAFFRTVFGFEPEPPQEFMEPHGRLRSIALRPPAGDVRIVLNVTEASPSAPQPARRHPGRPAVRRRRGDGAAAAVLGHPADAGAGQLLRRPRRPVRPGARAPRAPARAPPALRPGRRRRAAARLHRGPGHRLPRRGARAARRVRRLRQRQHLRAPGLPAGGARATAG